MGKINIEIAGKLRELSNCFNNQTSYKEMNKIMNSTLRLIFDDLESNKDYDRLVIKAFVIVVHFNILMNGLVYDVINETIMDKTKFIVPENMNFFNRKMKELADDLSYD